VKQFIREFIAKEAEEVARKMAKVTSFLYFKLLKIRYRKIRVATRQLTGATLRLQSFFRMKLAQKRYKTKVAV